MERNENGRQAEVSMPITSVHNTCPEMAQQFGYGAIALSIIIGITVLIRSLTELVRAKS
jgi:hypothetical protein